MPGESHVMAVTSIRQTVTLPASPHEVYEALMDARIHARFTGGGAKISRKVGGAFSVFDGYAEGVNLELVPDRKIAQRWRASDWPPDHYSTLTFSLTRITGGTRLTLRQRGVPAGQVKAISDGWREFYWAPLKTMLQLRAPR